MCAENSSIVRIVKSEKRKGKGLKYSSVQSGPVAISEGWLGIGPARPEFEKPVPQKTWRPAGFLAACRPGGEFGGQASCNPAGPGRFGTLKYIMSIILY